ncbi:hypothetical protein [Chryseolinea sp. T2]|uniref:hypothetical protein n=1 Tax=Chryseolinea sp. T2 TaxID=3129255 RepID=UPI0030780B65
MNLKAAVWALVTLTSSISFGQSIKKCDGSVLSITSEKIGKLSEQEIGDFLSTFGEECRNNVEFTEWSNELLFDVMEMQTQLTLTTIEQDKRIDLGEILEVIASPLLDEDIDTLIAKVRSTNVEPKLKQKVLEKLTIAKNSLKN